MRSGPPAPGDPPCQGIRNHAPLPSFCRLPGAAFSQSPVSPPATPRLDGLIRRVHAAASDERRWAGALGALRRLMGGRSVILAHHDFALGRGEWLVESPANPDARRAYAAEHSARNPWFMSSLEYRPGRVMTGDEVLHPDELVRTDFYRQHLRRLGWMHRLCGVVARRGDQVWYLDVLRGPGEPTFAVAERHRFRAVLRHVSLSLEQHWSLRDARQMNRALRAVIDELAPAVFVVDARARVLLSNARCEPFLEQCAGLQLRQDRLFAEVHTEQRALLEAVARAAAADPELPGGGAADQVVSLGNGRGLPATVLLVRPAGRLAAAEGGAREGAAVIVGKTQGPTEHDMGRCVFPRLFALTPAQARLAGLVLSGTGLSDCARRLGVSENTVRSHLKQIYQKTDCHGQLDLVRLHAQVCTEFM